MRRSLAVLVALAVTVLNPASAAAGGDPNPKAEAQIALTFGADCTSFTAVSSKDISNVVIQFGDGTVVKDESMNTPQYAYAGSGAITSAAVKSGRTVRTFACDPGEPDPGPD